MKSDKLYCPYWDCNVVIVNECGSNVRKSKCPNCNRFFCFKCREVWHSGIGCKGSRRDAMDSNDAAFRRLVRQNKWNRSPQCQHFVELRGGCHIVLCRCGIRFCYKCGRQVHHPLNCCTTYLEWRRCCFFDCWITVMYAVAVAAIWAFLIFRIVNM